MDTSAPRGTSHGLANAARERDPNCIENSLKTIEVNLEEALNSAANLADKIRPEQKADKAGMACPVASDLSSRLQAMENTVRFINQHLSSAHLSISG